MELYSWRTIRPPMSEYLAAHVGLFGRPCRNIRLPMSDYPAAHVGLSGRQGRTIRLPMLDYPPTMSDYLAAKVSFDR